MKSFNEFVSIKESAFTDAQAAAEKSIILKKVREINVILNSMPGTSEAATIRRESGKLEYAMMSMAKGVDLDTVKKESGDPLTLAQRIDTILQTIPRTVKEIVPIRDLFIGLSLKIDALPEYAEYNSDIQKNISQMGQAVGSQMKQAPPPKPKPKYPWENS